MKFFLFLIFMSNALLAQTVIDPQTGKVKVDPVAKIEKVIGEAFRIPNEDRKKEIELKPGMELFVGDRIKTKEKSLVKFILNDDTQTALGPETDFEISRFTMENKNLRKMTLNLLKGHMRTNVPNKLDRNGDIEIKLNKVSMGIRGTQFVSEIVKKSKNLETKIALIEGKAFLNLTDLNLKVLKQIGMEPGQVFDSSIVKFDSSEEQILFPLTNDQLQQLMKNEEGAVFLKDLVAKNEKGELIENKTNEKGELQIQKRTKPWKDILEQDQNSKKNF